MIWLGIAHPATDKVVGDRFILHGALGKFNDICIFAIAASAWKLAGASKLIGRTSENVHVHKAKLMLRGNSVSVAGLDTAGGSRASFG